MEASTNQELNQTIPRFNLPPKIVCRVVHIELKEVLSFLENRKENRSWYKGCTLAVSRKSGRWYSEIRNPMTNSRGSVGTYDTAEEALEALNRKRRAYAVINNAEKKLNQSTVVAGEDMQAHSGTITNYNVDLTDSKSCDIVAVNANVDDIQIPTSSFVSNEVFDTGLINAYGQLIGEFSKLDDELWLGESLKVDDTGCHKRLNILDEDAD